MKQPRLSELVEKIIDKEDKKEKAKQASYSPEPRVEESEFQEDDILKKFNKMIGERRINTL